MARVPWPPGAQRADDEEEVAEDSHDDRDDIQGDPAPLVLIVDGVAHGGDTRVPVVQDGVSAKWRYRGLDGVNVGRGH